MAGHYRRIPILLEFEQFRRLSTLARAEGRSISSLIREFVQYGLDARRHERRCRAAALARLTERRREMAARCGVYQGDPVADARVDRDAEIDSVLTGK